MPKLGGGCCFFPQQCGAPAVSALSTIVCWQTTRFELVESEDSQYFPLSRTSLQATIMPICGFDSFRKSPTAVAVVLKGCNNWWEWYLELEERARALGVWEHIDPDAPELPEPREPALPTRELAVKSVLARRATSPTASQKTTKEMAAESPPSEEAITAELINLGEECFVKWKTYHLKGMAARKAHKQLGNWLSQSVDCGLLADACLETLGSNQNSHRAVIQYLKVHFAPSKASIVRQIEASGHAQPERPNTSCEHCQRVFGSESARDQHAQAKHPDAYCGQCSQLFSSQFEREQHDQAWHPYTYCGRCKQHFSSTSAKEYHLASSTSHHICERCSDRPDFLSESDLNEHAEKDHHHCEVCNIEFYTRPELTQHDVDVHNMCEICGEFFMAPSNLNSVRTPDPVGSADEGLQSASRLTSQSTCKPTPQKTSSVRGAPGCSSPSRPWFCTLRLAPASLERIAIASTTLLLNATSRKSTPVRTTRIPISNVRPAASPSSG